MKVRVCLRTLTFLGHRIDEEGLRPCPEKVCAVTKMATQQNTFAIRKFLGMVDQLANSHRSLQRKAKLYVICLKSKMRGHGD